MRKYHIILFLFICCKDKNTNNDKKEERTDKNFNITSKLPYKITFLDIYI